jgi:2-keto-3-deoxy-L-rhamnonate aldolase RhmA
MNRPEWATSLTTEEVRRLESTALSGFEWMVLDYYRKGRSRSFITDALRCHPGSVVNAVARIKRKIARMKEGTRDA